MNTSSPRRRLWAAVPLAVPALLGGLVLGSGGAPHLQVADAAQVPAAAVVAHGHSASRTANQTAGVPASHVVLRQNMRLLWVQHMEWTRMAVVDFASGSAGFSASADRLLQNQADIGASIQPYYGRAAADRLTQLLRSHITNFVALFQAAKAKDDAAYRSAKRAVYANAQEIADFLAKADPKHWPQQAMRAMLKGHIDQTIAYGSDQLAGKYARSIAGYDRAESHMLMLADALSSGIIKAFPGQFR
jgi:hypothetical protein